MEYLEQVQTWTKGGIRVIGVDGYTGAGKTTIANSISNTVPKSNLISIDAFTEAVNPEDFCIHKDPQKILQQYIENQNIPEVLRELQSKDNVVIVEGPFLLHPDSLSGHIQKFIFIDGDKMKFEERRNKRESIHEIPQELHMLTDYFKSAYEYYQKIFTPKQKADLVITND